MEPITAIHESGHAVTAWLLGLPVKLIRVDGAGRGLLQHPDNLHFRYAKAGREDEWHRVSAAVALGGLVAEDFYLRAQTMPMAAAASREPGEFFKWALQTHSSDGAGDIPRVRRYCRQSAVARETEARAFQLFLEVHGMITTEFVWPIVEDLAVELVGRRLMGPKSLEPFRERALNADLFGPLAMG